MQTISKGVYCNVPIIGYCVLFQICFKINCFPNKLKVGFFNNVFWYNMVLLLKRIGATKRDNCLDLYWQLWLSRIIRLKSVLVDLTSLAVFMTDAHSSRWPNQDDTIPSVITEDCHFTHTATIGGHIWIVVGMKWQHGQSLNLAIYHIWQDVECVARVMDINDRDGSI